MELKHPEITRKFKKVVREIRMQAPVKVNQWYAVGGLFRIHGDEAKTIEINGLMLKKVVE